MLARGSSSRSTGWVVAAVAVVLLIAVAAFATADNVLGDERGDGGLEEGHALLGDAQITVDEAVAAAQSQASGPVGDVELERHGGKLVFEVEVGEADVHVNAIDGSVLAVDGDDDEGEADDDRDGAGLPEPGISADEAIAAAQAVASGTLGEVDLENEGGRLVYSIEIGGREVIVDANDGSVLANEFDD